MFNRFLVTGFVVLVAAHSFAAEDAPPAHQPATSSPATQPGDASKADALLRRADDFMGGRGRMDAIESASYKATSATPAGDVTLTFAFKKPGKIFFATQRAGQPEADAKMGSDGAVHWVFDPRFGGYNTTDASMMSTFISNTDLFGLVFNLRQRYASFSEPERTTYEGRDAYKVNMRGPKHGSAAGVFDVETGRILALVFTQHLGNTSRENHMVFSDWQEIPGSGITMFREMPMKSGSNESKMRVTEMSVGAVDESLFAVPDEIKEILANPPASTSPAPGGGGMRPPVGNPQSPAPR